MLQATKNMIQESPLIVTLDNLMNRSQCQALIEQSEQEHEYSLATITIGPNTFLGDTGVRNNDRVIFDDHCLAEQLFVQVAPFLPERVHDCWHLKGLNERFRFYRYGKGHRFRMHFDGAFMRNQCERSFLTLMFYLNEDFEGGETTFFECEEESDFVELKHVVRPATGGALFFEHAQLHEGSEVKDGLKYVLRTDVMYQIPNAL